ncbi:sarcosine oxidase subunit gamma [Bradyrhizobium sp. Ec3.3]|uniref:sarcosine oxidase subunit gamma n=1 Tax=Bradyrhizobium sp. Ec3.3 TaxID=189753 RepID=UPI00048A2D3F|nr:sarcosine oxidase subunit gamma family protein [Bradyrhizobium sp. Ec3.3]
MDKQETSIWRPRRPWAGFAEAGQIGESREPGITAVTLEGLGFATLIAGTSSEKLERATKRLLGLDLPREPCAALSDTHGLVWSGPDQWLLLARKRTGFSDLLVSLSVDAAVSEQSHGRSALRLSGKRVRDVLAKGSMVDVHQAAFPVGTAALTSFAHIGVQFWRTQDGPDGAAFEILIARSMAGSFWSWLAASAAEFGFCVTIDQA